MIAQGQKLPAATLSQLTKDGMVNHQVTELFAGKKVVLFAVPGAFTPTCSEAHLPGYVVLADQFKAKGVDLIACESIRANFGTCKFSGSDSTKLFNEIAKFLIGDAKLPPVCFWVFSIT